MFESKRIEDVMTKNAIRIRPGHYVDTHDESSHTYRLWVRHGKNFNGVDPTDGTCLECADADSNTIRAKCLKFKLNAEQQKSVPLLIALLNRTGQL